MKWGAIGDVVITSAMFEDIFNAFPGCETDLNTTPPCDSRFRQVLAWICGSPGAGCAVYLDG